MISDRLNLFSLVLPRSRFQVKFLHGQSVQRIALAWGIGWRRGANPCSVPTGLAKHTNKRKADRGIGKKESKEILHHTGSLFPQDLVCNQLCYSEVKPRALCKLCV